MSDVYRADIILPSAMSNSVIVDMQRASRQMMAGHPWIVRPYGFATTDKADWKDSVAEAWDAAAEDLEVVVAKYQQQIDRCRAEAAKARQEVASA